MNHYHAVFKLSAIFTKKGSKKWANINRNGIVCVPFVSSSDTDAKISHTASMHCLYITNSNILLNMSRATM